MRWVAMGFQSGGMGVAAEAWMSGGGCYHTWMGLRLERRAGGDAGGRLGFEAGRRRAGVACGNTHEGTIGLEFEQAIRQRFSV